MVRYTALNVSLTVADDYHLLSEMYDNFMFGTVKTNSHKENNSPGSLSKALDTSKVDKRRIQVYFFLSYRIHIAGYLLCDSSAFAGTGRQKRKGIAS